jgi:hypothetical protein
LLTDRGKIHRHESDALETHPTRSAPLPRDQSEQKDGCHRQTDTDPQQIRRLDRMVERPVPIQRVGECQKQHVENIATDHVADASLNVRALVPLLRGAGVIPRIRRVSGDALCAEWTAAGFDIAQRWSPRRDATVFIVACKPSLRA